MNPEETNKPTPEPAYPVFGPGDHQPNVPSPAPRQYPPPTPPQSDHHDNWRSIASTVALFLLAPIIALSIAAFVIQSYQVDGQSMETTLQDHDRLIVEKTPRTWARLTHHAYIPHRGDIIIFNQSGLPDAGSSDQKQLIKRVVGLPGERVVVQNGQVRVYNQEFAAGFNPDSQTGYHITATNTPGNLDVRVPAGHIFVCGDNRTNSEDSRYFGPVNANNIVGRLKLRILPLGKFQSF